MSARTNDFPLRRPQTSHASVEPPAKAVFRPVHAQKSSKAVSSRGNPKSALKNARHGTHVAESRNQRRQTRGSSIARRIETWSVPLIQYRRFRSVLGVARPLPGALLRGQAHDRPRAADDDTQPPAATAETQFCPLRSAPSPRAATPSIRRAASHRSETLGGRQAHPQPGEDMRRGAACRTLTSHACQRCAASTFPAGGGDPAFVATFYDFVSCRRSMATKPAIRKRHVKNKLISRHFPASRRSILRTVV